MVHPLHNDSSTFDLRTGSLTVDKDVYVLGSDVVITLTDPDLNLDSTTCESYAMSLIEWDSSASSSKLLNNEDTTPTDFTSQTHQALRKLVVIQVYSRQY